MQIINYYFFDYYPFGTYGSNLNNEHLSNQRFIMDLKGYPELNYDHSYKGINDNLIKKNHNIKKAAHKFIKYISQEIKPGTRDFSDIVLFVVPSSKLNNDYHGITLVAEEILRLTTINSGLPNLKRVKDIDASHQNDKIRSKTKQLNSLTYLKNNKFENKIFLLIDDVVTSGSSRDACIEKISKNNPKLIYFVTLSKTV